jgi:hypothetical protein
MKLAPQKPVQLEQVDVYTLLLYGKDALHVKTFAWFFFHS